MHPVEEALAYRFNDSALLELALTHRSWVEERHPGGAAPGYLSQQRLEFLGDAILNYAVGRWLYLSLPTAEEGELTERRKRFTEGGWLHERGLALGLHRWVRLGRGEAARVDRNRTLIEDTTEAVIGAVALDGGDEAAFGLIRRWLPTTLPHMEVGDPIIRFNEWFQARYRRSPPEPTYASTGRDDAKEWTAEVEHEGIRVVGRGAGKKEAKKHALGLLLERLPGVGAR